LIVTFRPLPSWNAWRTGRGLSWTEHLGVKSAASRELVELLKETKLDELSDKLDKALPSEK
jgi:hypothetical protein